VALVDELEEYWAFLKEGRPPRPPEPEPPPPPPEPAEPCVWLGLLDSEGREASYGGYRRVRMTANPENLSFPVVTSGTLTIHSLGIFTEEQGGSHLLAIPVARYMTVATGDTLALAAGSVGVSYEGRPGMSLNEALSRAGTAENLLSTLINAL